MTEMTERPVWAATDKQRNYIKKLIELRDVAPDSATVALELCDRDDFEKTDASAIIDSFAKAPWRKGSGGGTGSAPTDLTSTLIVSKFAVPIHELPIDLAALAGHSELLFGEVREWNGHKFINALKGAPGAFNRTRIKGVQRATISGILAKDQLRYVKLFGAHYTCCGSCGAELTDEMSRTLQLGPECRKKFGF